MRNEKLKYADDLTANELFDLAGRALANPGDAESRRGFWRFVDTHGDHPWVQALTRGAAASHPRGVTAGNQLIGTAIDDAHHKPCAFQPDWLKGVYQTFERA